MVEVSNAMISFREMTALSICITSLIDCRRSTIVAITSSISLSMAEEHKQTSKWTHKKIIVKL